VINIFAAINVQNSWHYFIYQLLPVESISGKCLQVEVIKQMWAMPLTLKSQ
jgi:hypothetical protein